LIVQFHPSLFLFFSNNFLILEAISGIFVL
jgi:aspartate oxidase